MTYSQKSDIVSRVRALTSYGTDVISDNDVNELIDIAQDELQGEVGYSNTLSFLGGSSTMVQDHATFWLTCLFVKVHTGEIGAPEFDVGELRMRDLNNTHEFWLTQYDQNRRQISGNKGYGVAQYGRTDREYAFER